ncbi:hypothetical protein VP01_5861g2 [Puccinia sorghi]|uniref:Uncharacterized protein n=1 Tax=Puccinia sorghi TaxID=27349 RepID=A0A0L6UI22_9BASI|nr:hypothetical protein VP01_5861g2 [Puccinia sorghi]
MATIKETITSLVPNSSLGVTGMTHNSPSSGITSFVYSAELKAYSSDGCRDICSEIRHQLKHVRNKVRNILLTGLILNVSPDYIPNITEHARPFWRHCNGSKTGKTNNQVDDKITVMLKVCIAHLRLATVANFLDPKDLPN